MTTKQIIEICNNKLKLFELLLIVRLFKIKSSSKIVITLYVGHIMLGTKFEFIDRLLSIFFYFLYRRNNDFQLDKYVIKIMYVYSRVRHIL